MADESVARPGADPIPLLVVECRGLVLPTLTNTREHWAVAMKRAETHRGQVRLLADAAIGRTRARHTLRFTREHEGLLVRITRIAKKACDHGDGTNTACKHVRDGLADSLGIDDGCRSVEWTYAERAVEKGCVPGALIEVFARAVCACCGQYMPLRSGT